MASPFHFEVLNLPNILGGNAGEDISDGEVKFLRLSPCYLSEIVGGRGGVENAARRVDECVTAETVPDGCLKVATLRADAGDEDQQLSNNLAHALELFGVSRTDDEATVPIDVPRRADAVRHVLIEFEARCGNLSAEVALDFTEQRSRQRNFQVLKLPRSGI